MDAKQIYNDTLKQIAGKFEMYEKDSADYIECRRIFHLTILNIVYAGYFSFKKNEDETILVTDEGDEYLIESNFLEGYLTEDELDTIYSRTNIKQEEVIEQSEIVPDHIEVPEINEKVEKVAVVEERETKPFIPYEELLVKSAKEIDKPVPNVNPASSTLMAYETKKDTKDGRKVRDKKQPPVAEEKITEKSKQKVFHYTVPAVPKKQEENVTVPATATFTSKTEAKKYTEEIGKMKKRVDSFYYDEYQIICKDINFILNVYPIKRQAVAMLGTMIFITLYDGKEYFRGYISENENKTSITFNYNGLTINVTGKWRNGRFISTVMNRSDPENTQYIKTEKRPLNETENTHLITEINNEVIHIFPAMFENHIRHGLCGCCIYNETANEIFIPTGQFIVGCSKREPIMFECFIHGKDTEAILNIEERK